MAHLLGNNSLAGGRKNHRVMEIVFLPHPLLILTATAATAVETAISAAAVDTGLALGSDIHIKKNKRNKINENKIEIDKNKVIKDMVHKNKINKHNTNKHNKSYFEQLMSHPQFGFSMLNRYTWNAILIIS